MSLYDAALRPLADIGDVSVTLKPLAPLWDADARTKGEPVERDRPCPTPAHSTSGGPQL